jgi:hypothetical protein
MNNETLAEALALKEEINCQSVNIRRLDEALECAKRQPEVFDPQMSIDVNFNLELGKVGKEFFIAALEKVRTLYELKLGRAKEGFRDL